MRVFDLQVAAKAETLDVPLMANDGTIDGSWFYLLLRQGLHGVRGFPNHCPGSTPTCHPVEDRRGEEPLPKLNPIYRDPRLESLK